MPPLVIHEVALRYKTLAAVVKRASVRSFTGMYAHVDGEIALLREGLSTLLTLERFFSCVCPLMDLQARKPAVRLVAARRRADKWLDPRVYYLVRR